MSLLRRVLLVLGVLVVLVFAVMGVQRAFPGTPIRHVRVVGEASSALAVGDPSFVGMVEALTGVEVGPGHGVQLLRDGDGTFPALWREMRGARGSVTVRQYYMLPGAVADTLAAVLGERARAGVRVLFLYDAFGTTMPDEYFDRMRGDGVEVQAYRPFRWYSVERAQHRSHVRAVVVDGRVGFTGGMGFDDRWLGDGASEAAWRDTNVRFTGPAVRHLQGAFAAGWAEATGVLPVGELFFPPGAVPDSGVAAGLLYTVPGLGSTDAERFLALSIAGARETLYITNAYFVPDDDLLRLLADAAERGVDVRVLTAGEHTDMRSARLAGRSQYEALLEAGVRIYEYAPTMVHAKTLVADGVWSSVGTMNFDNRSAALNEESNLLVRDPAFGAAMQAMFADDLRLSREIRLEEFRARPWSQRLLERGAAVMARVL